MCVIKSPYLRTYSLEYLILDQIHELKNREVFIFLKGS